jgi:predicted DNA-binding antitoxin AbrB/MazE fold protein
MDNASAQRAIWQLRAGRDQRPLCGIIFGVAMSIKVTYKDGVFEPLEEVKGARPGQRYTVFSDEELDELRETLGWLKAAEKSFEFWNNPADGVYDTL